jgi:hypothetical protein
MRLDLDLDHLVHVRRTENLDRAVVALLE